MVAMEACGRSDLESKGPEYINQNCRLCHLHFEEKWYNINKIRARLYPDAVSTKFSGSTFDKNNEAISNMEEEENVNTTQEMQHDEETQILHKIAQQKDEIQKLETDIQLEERNRALYICIKSFIYLIWFFSNNN